MIYITGDTHREFGTRLSYVGKSKENMLIVLGDAGINYFLDKRDKKLKELLSKNNIKFFCIQGNHEERPENIRSYKEKEMFGGKVFVEDKYPNLIFAKNGEVYNIGGKSVLVIGGAYSVDKYYRIKDRKPWFKDEQLTEKEKVEILDKYIGKHVDVILSHTCPAKYVPTEAFLVGLDQSTVDTSMEQFLDIIEENVDYDKWYCGHYHIHKNIDKLEIMYWKIKDFSNDTFLPRWNEKEDNKVKVLKK